MDIPLLLANGIDPALRLLPAKMGARQAKVMLVAMALQESGAKHRRQIRGPARGYWQFEQGGGVAGVLRHRSSSAHAKAVCLALDYKASRDAVYTALEHNDILAASFARLLLWTLPSALPTTADDGWAQYLDAWRPGKPHPATWAGHWATADLAISAV